MKYSQPECIELFDKNCKFNLYSIQIFLAVGIELHMRQNDPKNQIMYLPQERYLNVSKNKIHEATVQNTLTKWEYKICLVRPDWMICFFIDQYTLQILST